MCEGVLRDLLMSSLDFICHETFLVGNQSNIDWCRVAGRGLNLVRAERYRGVDFKMGIGRGHGTGNSVDTEWLQGQKVGRRKFGPIANPLDGRRPEGIVDCTTSNAAS